MLTKLIRHELAETWKIPVLIIAISVLLSLACALYFHLAPLPGPNVELNVGNMIIYILYAFLLAAVSLLITIYLGIRFYKNMYTDEGYLMHTLPVRPWMHITAKTVAGSIWSYLGSAMVLVTLYPVTVIALPKIAYADPAELENMKRIFFSIFGENTWLFIFYLIPFMLVSSISSALMLYGAVCLGQLFGKHKAFSSILCYIGLDVLVSSVASLFMLPGMTGIAIVNVAQTPDSISATEQTADHFLNVVMPSMMHTAFMMAFLANIVLAVAFFFLCNYLMKKCLNLD